MRFKVKIRGDKATIRRQEKIRSKVKGNVPEAYRAACLVGVRIFSNIYAEQGKRFGGWKQPGVWTKLLRAKTGKKYKTLAEVRAHKVKPLQDTGISRASFGLGGRDGILRVWGNRGEVGSSLNYLRTHDKGLTSIFRFGKEQESRLERNFRKTLDGPKKAGSKAKKNWNPEYFITENAMKKANGKRFKIPKRRIGPGNRTITQREKQDVYIAFETELRRILKETQRATS